MQNFNMLRNRTHFDTLVDAVDDPCEKAGVEHFAEGVSGSCGFSGAQISHYVVLSRLWAHATVNHLKHFYKKGKIFN